MILWYVIYTVYIIILYILDMWYYTVYTWYVVYHRPDTLVIFVTPRATWKSLPEACLLEYCGNSKLSGDVEENVLNTVQGLHLGGWENFSGADVFLKNRWGPWRPHLTLSSNPVSQVLLESMHSDPPGCWFQAGKCCGAHERGTTEGRA